VATAKTKHVPYQRRLRKVRNVLGKSTWQHIL